MNGSTLSVSRPSINCIVPVHDGEHYLPENHPGVAVSISQVARRRAQTIFNWEHHVDTYDKLYQTLIGKNGAERAV
jgi:hypothetical protein